MINWSDVTYCLPCFRAWCMSFRQLFCNCCGCWSCLRTLFTSSVRENLTSNLSLAYGLSLTFKYDSASGITLSRQLFGRHPHSWVLSEFYLSLGGPTDVHYILLTRPLSRTISVDLYCRPTKLNFRRLPAISAEPNIFRRWRLNIKFGNEGGASRPSHI